MAEKKPSGLALLRVPFPENQISKLPKASKKQNEDLKKDFKLGIRCNLCGGWHLPDVIHLDYVGHAALTDRLLDADPNWTWEPLTMDAEGLPKLDRNGGLWIKLTVCGLTRLGYGNAEGKSGGDAIKEIIGDALRNAAMRFGAALDLWHKGELHVDTPEPEAPKEASKPPEEPKKPAPLAPQEITYPFNSSIEGKKLKQVDTPTLSKAAAWLKSEITKDPKPADVKQKAFIYSQVKAVLLDRNPPPPDDIPENTPPPEEDFGPIPDIDNESQDPADYLIEPVEGLDLGQALGKKLKSVPEKELRAIQKAIDAEMRIPGRVGGITQLFELRNRITLFFKTME